MKEIILDCRTLSSRDSLHRAFADALSFPESCRNLDALHDCLTALPEETRLTLASWQAAEDALGRYARALTRMLEDARQENSLLHIQYL